MPQRYITTRISLRRGSEEKWRLENPVLNEGEPGLEIDTGRVKFGNGETTWNDLDYYKVGDSETSGTFMHNGQLIPDYITTVSSAIEYLGHQFKILNTQGLDDFNSGVNGGTANFLITVASSNGGAASHSGGSQSSFPEGEILQLSVTPFGGYEFSHWEGPVSDTTDPNATLTVTGNLFVRAFFKILGS